MNDSNHDMEYLQHCRELIEKKLNWRPAAEWRNYEFTDLSERILDATGVHLSGTTLKRVFGKLKYASLPSTTTLNTLAAYLSFSSWMDFKSRAGAVLPSAPPKRPRIKTGVLWIAAAALCITVVTTILSGRSSPPLKNPDEIVFTSRPISSGLPNSVVFNVDLQGNKPENILIQQYWDTSKTVRMTPGQTEATGIYYFPGYFRAKLILDGKTVKEHDLFIRADKWMATIDRQPIPTYVKDDELKFNGKMGVTAAVEATIRQNTEPTYLSYHLVRPFENLASDNFTLETSLKNTVGEGPAVCKTAKIFVLCSKGAFIVPFTIPGCISDINLKLNDYYLPGKKNDLSSLGTGLDDWTPVKVEVKNRTVKIFLRGHLVREEKYLEDAGEVVGLRFSFLGAGSVQYARLRDGEGRLVYNDEFGAGEK